MHVCCILCIQVSTNTVSVYLGMCTVITVSVYPGMCTVTVSVYPGMCTVTVSVYPEMCTDTVYLYPLCVQLLYLCIHYVYSYCIFWI